MHDPERHVELAAEHPLRIEQHGDDAHRLLRVVAAVAERVQRRRHELQYAEAPVDGERRRARRLTHCTMTTISCASTKPSSGDSTMPARRLAEAAEDDGAEPALAMPAPARPPISAWLLLDGMPSPHVIDVPDDRAGQRAEDHAARRRCSASTMPVPTVFATCSPNTANAMKLKNAAQMTAVCGRSTRVDTTVAIELAASCRPFRKSNSSATRDQARGGRSEPSASVSSGGRASDVLRGDRSGSRSRRRRTCRRRARSARRAPCGRCSRSVSSSPAASSLRMRVSAGSNDSSARSSICPIFSHSAKIVS